MRTTLLVAALLLSLHAAFVAFGPRPREARFQTGDQLNRHVIEQYVQAAPKTELVFVGSSMTARLGAFADAESAFNLALSGESFLTGLEVLAQINARPKLVLVEINVPERKANLRLAGQAASVSPAWLPTLAAQNMPVNLLFSFLSNLKPASVQADGVDDVRLETALAVQRDVYSQEIAPAILRENLLSLSSQIRKLESSGAEVIFFELPIHPELENSVRARQIRAAFAAEFPGHRTLGASELSQGIHVRTIDGVHLAYEEAAAVRSALLANGHREQVR